MTVHCHHCSGTSLDSEPAGKNPALPWMLSHQCRNVQCQKTTFTCDGTCVINNNKRPGNSSYPNIRAARRHHKVCHKGYAEIPPVVDDTDETDVMDGTHDNFSSMLPFDETSPYQSVLDSCNQGEYFAFAGTAAGDGDETLDMEEPDLVYDQIPAEDSDPFGNCQSFECQETVTDKFRNQIVVGNAWSAASILVKQAAFQTTIVPVEMLPVPNIMLFLYLARLVMSSGLIQQHYLSKLLLILYPFADSSQKNWAPLPCTESGFRSCFLNVSNSNALVSILPIPIPETLPDGHGYTPLRNILEHAFMMEKFDPVDTKDPKWHSLASSEKFQGFLRGTVNKGLASPSGLRQLSVGLLLWTDGWDPSTGCKSNRSPMHTGTVSLLIVDVESQSVVGVCTYPNMGGPGKIDHEPVFRRLLEDIESFESEGSNRRFPSRHFLSDVEVHVKVLFVVQDQPERRASSGLLGGGSIMHPMFGVSCDFQHLRLPFEACHHCVLAIEAYLAAKDWSHPPLTVNCEHCLGWSLERLTKTSYRSRFKLPGRPPAADDNRIILVPPGVGLFDGPGRLVSKLLKMAWNHCIHEFVHEHRWVEADVKLYFGILCINNATIDAFIETCRKYMYLKEMTNHPDRFTADQIAQFEADFDVDPQSYVLPLPPAMWSLGDIDDKTEGIMHLSMGIQKAVFKFIILWATSHNRGAALQRRLADILRSIQELNVAYCPCRPYKDEKFGGFTAEGYRAMTLTSLYIYRCLLEITLQPPPRRDTNPKPQKEWTRQDNLNWMYVRGIDYSRKILLPESREMVRGYMLSDPVPEVIKALPEPISASQIRDLVWRMYNMFRAIFCTDLGGKEAKHRATASVMRFLSLMETLDAQQSPKRLKPIWIAKFNFLGLLRVCESFVPFQHVRNLYEGGEIGEGIVKKLRPFVAKGVHGRWATNLLLCHYRNCTLDGLIDALEDNSQKKKGCLLGVDVEASKFKRYSTVAEVTHLMENGCPLPCLLYGSEDKWRAGVIVVSQKRWYFREIVFERNGDCVVDDYGLTYHRVHLAEQEFCFGGGEGQVADTLGQDKLPFWGYALLFADLIEDHDRFRYAIVRTGWQHLDADNIWSEHD
jgi:hypothetical protein